MCSSWHASLERPAGWASARRAWELQEVTTAAMGCEAAPESVTSVVSGAPRLQVLLPVPDISRTSEASPGPLPRRVWE
ncbi:hypothetical protein JN853_26125 [Pseudomonas syringae pv. actinidiae ICMP 9853]|nr:hypothetical protein JN853_26125 [Pseudomonas syringae pv. actinidiae ICMP 9853]AQX57461.1 hypothetical protein B1R35_04290 [Pseudomonas syringae pv. actinidiae]AQX63356.1 hypothetical protein B1F85_04290 [Pseudomonas syringae pv. actinidiae]